MLDAQPALQEQPALFEEFEPASPKGAQLFHDEPVPALPFRADTMLGVCEAIGEDFGFHPNWLRVVFAALVLWNPVAIFSIYLGLGAAVALSRWLHPKPVAAAAPHLAADRRSAHADNQAEAGTVSLAA